MIHIYPVQSVPRRPIPLRSCLLLFCYLRLGHPSGYFPSSIPNRTLYEFISPYACYMPLAIAVCLFSLPKNIWQGKPVHKLLFILSSLLLSSSSYSQNIVLCTLFCNILSLYSSLSVKLQVSKPHKTTDIVQFCFNFYVFV